MRDAVDTEVTFADHGSGSVKAILVRDRVCLTASTREKVCAWPAVNMAIAMDSVPFRAMPNDGIVGLGLTALSQGSECNFFEKLFSLRHLPFIEPEFGISLSATGGELFIGGYNRSGLAAPLQWFPVHSPEEGFWQVPILAVRIGGILFDSCERGCHAIVDTGASRLGVQDSNLAKLRDALTSEAGADGGHCQGPAIEFDLGGMKVRLDPEEYTNSDCSPDLGPLDVQEPLFTGVYTFGETVLRHYFVAFNWKDRTIGFAPSAGREVATASTEENIFM